MRRRLLFIALTLPIWAVVLFLGLESWERLHWEWTLRTNTLVRQMQGQQPWRFASKWEGMPTEQVVAPHLDAPVCPPLDGLAPLPAAAAAEASPSPYAASIWSDDIIARLGLFEALTEEERALFDVLGREVCLADEAGQVLAYRRVWEFRHAQSDDDMVGEAVSALWGPEVVALVKQVYASGKPKQQTFSNMEHPEHEPVDVVAFPARDAAGAVTGVYCIADPSPPLDPKNAFSDPFYRYKRHFMTEDGGFRSNNLGFRGGDIAMPKPRGTYRILCLGGSTTFEGMTEASHYPRLLEDMLQSCFVPVRQMEVINGGMPGMYSYGHRARFLEYMALDPDLIVYYMGINDIWQQLFPRWIDMAAPLQVVARQSLFVRHWFNWQLMPPEATIRKMLVDTTMDEIATMLTYARKYGVHVAICSFAYPRDLSARERAYYEWQNKSFHLAWSGDNVSFSTLCRVMDIYNEMLRAFCEKEGVPYIPVQENIRGGFNFFGDVCHMRDEAIPVKARIIFEHVKELVAADLRAAEAD